MNTIWFCESLMNDFINDLATQKWVIIQCSQYTNINLNPSPISNQIFNPSMLKHDNRTLVRDRVGVRAWIKIYIRVLRTWNYYPKMADLKAWSHGVRKPNYVAS